MKNIFGLAAFLCILFITLISSETVFAQGDCGFSQGTGVSTAFGCIDTGSPSELINKILTIGTGIGGGIAFLLILFGGFQMLTSAGNPEQLNAGKELVTSAITGLLLIVFSIFLLRLIGVDILGIKGFG